MSTGAGLLVVLGVAGWFAVRAGLRPLRRIEDTAAAIAGGDLTRRIPDLAVPRTEVGRLSASLNGMLGQLENAFAARAASEEAMRAFVADVSHELRTPLFGIKGFAQLYLMGGLPERADVDRTMRRIDAEADRLKGLTENLLLLAQLDNAALHERAPVELEPTDLRTLAADAAHDLRALDPSRPIRLTGPGGGQAKAAPILGDEARLRQVVVNLVSNVVAHTPAGTPVRIGVGTADGAAVFEIADSGPGLSPEAAARVFDRFYRVDSSRARGGTGLGLAIVRSLVTTQGGDVELRTAPGEGATFRIVFPVLVEDARSSPAPADA
ncbi:HAMP domain-containing sensor histidine kinase [Saccharomonospora sp. NPDC046836]|uniref:sensor histidine kinase n=1 Tax=Saccharomonospora sp. NPDC046836 TaxID=3156921 RepID=UPI0033C18454